MKKIWDIIKTFLVALAVAYSYTKDFSFGDLFSISDKRLSWFINIATHTAILNFLFYFLETFLERNKVSITSYIYVDKDFKADSNYMLLEKDSPKSALWYIKVDGRKYLLPKHITLPYSDELVVQINKKKRDFIIIDDDKKVIKIRLRGFLQNQILIKDEEREFDLSIMNDDYSEDSRGKANIILTPQCLGIKPFVKTDMKSLKVKIKGEG